MNIDELKPGESIAAAELLGHAFVSNPNCIAAWRGQGEAERKKQAALFQAHQARSSSSKGVGCTEPRVDGRCAQLPCTRSLRVQLLLAEPFMQVSSTAGDHPPARSSDPP